MDKTKRMLIILLAVLGVLVIILFGVMLVKNRDNMSVKKNQSAVELAQKENTSDALSQKVIGKITAIEGESLTVLDSNSPITPLTKNKVGVNVSLKTSNATAVFFVENGKSQAKKQLADMRVGDMVRAEYNNLTKEIKTVYVSIGDADLGNVEK